MDLELEILSGKRKGKTLPLPVNNYVLIARKASMIDVTMEISTGGDRALGDTALEIAERFVASRGGRGVTGHRLGLRTRLPDIEIDDNGVSRTHAMVFHDAAGPSVVDLMSTNGTYVNSALVSDADLEPGDIIKVGETEIRIRASS